MRFITTIALFTLVALSSPTMASSGKPDRFDELLPDLKPGVQRFVDQLNEAAPEVGTTFQAVVQDTSKMVGRVIDDSVRVAFNLSYRQAFEVSDKLKNGQLPHHLTPGEIVRFADLEILYKGLILSFGMYAANPDDITYASIKPDNPTELFVKPGLQRICQLYKMMGHMDDTVATAMTNIEKHYHITIPHQGFWQYCDQASLKDQLALLGLYVYKGVSSNPKISTAAAGFACWYFLF
jgi:hypothetical protein